MSHVAGSHATAHRSPSVASARPQASPAPAQGGGTPAGLFALLLRSRQGDTDPAAEAMSESEAEAEPQDAPQDERAGGAESSAGERGAPSPEPAPVLAPDWAPTVRRAAQAEPTDEVDGGDALKRLGATARSRATGDHDALERSAAAELGQETAAIERPDIGAHEPSRLTATDRPADTLIAQAEADPQPQSAPAQTATGTLPSLGAVTDSAAAAPAPGEPAATARAHLPQPPTSPAFAPALGVQISTWLREGVQHAALELNPAELGPIDVRIALRDGQAQVALAAEVPFTRQILADALPQLAEALGDVGVQLAGGDVSDPAGGRARDEAGAQPRAGRTGRSAGDEAAPTAAPAASRPRGLLDLYA